MSSIPLLVTYEDTDPVIHYLPDVDGDNASQSGWRTNFPSNQFIVSPGTAGTQQGVGNSLRIAASKGSSLSFVFYGSSVRLFGMALDAEYTVAIDNNEPVPLTEKDGVLADLSGYAQGQHELNLTVTNPGTSFAFDRATFDTGLANQWKNETFNADDSAWSGTAGWFSILGVWPYKLAGTTSSSPTVSLTFKGSAVYLYGTLMPDHGTYEISLDGVSTQHNGYSKYGKGGSLLFFAGGLDPNAFSTLTLRNLEDRKWFDTSGAVVIAPEFPSSSSSSVSSTSSLASSTPPPNGPTSPSPASRDRINIGAVVGGVLGALTFIVCMIIIFCVLRRSRANRMSAPGSPFDAEKPGYGVPRPFIPPSSQGSWTQGTSHIAPTSTYEPTLRPLSISPMVSPHQRHQQRQFRSMWSSRSGSQRESFSTAPPAYHT